MASEIEGCELDVAYRELLGRGVQGGLAVIELAFAIGQGMWRLQNGYTVVLEHVEKPGYVSRCLAWRLWHHTWSFRHCHCGLVSIAALMSETGGYSQSEEEELGMLEREGQPCTLRW